MPESQIREQAHRLIDFMEPRQILEIVGLMQTMLSPFERNLANAPFDDEPISSEETSQIEAARTSLQRGEGISHANLMAEFSLAMANSKDKQAPAKTNNEER